MNGRDQDRVRRLLGWADDVAFLAAKGREHLEEDWIHQLAVERLLEMIGRSVTKFSGEFRKRYPEVSIKPTRTIRNTIAHDYENEGQPDYDEQWHAMTVDVPELAEALRQIGDVPDRL